MERFQSVFTPTNYGFNPHRESTTQLPIDSPYRVEFALEKHELEHLCSLLKQSLHTPNGHTFDEKPSIDFPSHFGTALDYNWDGTHFSESAKVSTASMGFLSVVPSFSQAEDDALTPLPETKSLVSQLNGVPISPSQTKINIKPSSISPPQPNGNHSSKNNTDFPTVVHPSPISPVGRTSPTPNTIPSPTAVSASPLILPVGSPSIELASQHPTTTAELWHTNPQTHNNDCIQKLFYINHLEGVPKSENNAGWLFSTSKGVISLWQCLEHSTTPLELVHSEHIDERILSMDIAQTSFYLVTASLPQQTQYLPQNPVKVQPSITLYSLGNDAAKFLKPKGKIPLSVEPTQILSLDSFGSPLNYSIVCSSGKNISIYDLRQAATPKAHWVAHNDIVSLLKRNPFSTSFASGSWDGSIHLWDLKNKPSQPQLTLHKHARTITSIEFLDTNNLISGSADGSVSFWDLRKVSAPIQTVIVDDKSILNCKLLGPQKTAAVATLKGLYLMDITTRQAKPLTNPAFKVVFPDITWNTQQQLPTLYTSTMDGKINVLSNIGK